VITNTRGSVFSMCERGLAGEPGYAKYPRLPVVRCEGFLEGAQRDIAPRRNGPLGGPLA
jgi:hypothetical protein